MPIAIKSFFNMVPYPLFDLFAQPVLHEPGVGLPPRAFHDLADQESQNFFKSPETFEKKAGLSEKPDF
jgi:hypothetical protein